jgi:hypothetical protein
MENPRINMAKSNFFMEKTIHGSGRGVKEGIEVSF